MRIRDDRYSSVVNKHRCLAGNHRCFDIDMLTSISSTHRCYKKKISKCQLKHWEQQGRSVLKARFDVITSKHAQSYI